MAIEALDWPATVPTPLRVTPRPMTRQEVDDGWWTPRVTTVNPLSERWEFRVEWGNMSHDDAHRLHAHLTRLNGREWPIKLPLPFYRRKLGSAGAGWAVSGTVAPGVFTLPLTGGSGTFAIGDWLVKEVSGNPMAYRVTVAGGSSVGIWPSFQASATGGSIQYLGDGSSTVLYCCAELTSDIDMVFDVLQHDAFGMSFFAEFIQSAPNRFL